MSRGARRRRARQGRLLRYRLRDAGDRRGGGRASGGGAGRPRRGLCGRSPPGARPAGVLGQSPGSRTRSSTGSTRAWPGRGSRRRDRGRQARRARDRCRFVSLRLRKGPDHDASGTPLRPGRDRLRPRPGDVRDQGRRRGERRLRRPAACAGCHAAETAAWRGSHHDLAMQEATPATVLGDFADASFTYGNVTSRFFTRDGRFLVNTDGPDGRLADFEIRYTFGVYPLQQYLIAFPDGRLQALGIAGTRGRRSRAGSAGSTSTRARTSTPARRSTGPAATRPGTSSAPSATRPT